MVDESKLIFFTGAPGSKWSATAHVLTHNTIMPINTSDYREDRYYQHPNPPVAHQGAYWGPGFEFGNQFHEINKLSKEEILAEIDAAYADKSWDKYRIIKCHQFSLNLDWIKENFPTSKIMIVLRPEHQCVHGWLTAGAGDGFKGITYPDYNPYYQNAEKFTKEVHRESQASKRFITENNLPVDLVRSKYWKDRWGIEKSTPELELYIESLECSKKHNEKYWNYDVLVAEYNFEESND